LSLSSVRSPQVWTAGVRKSAAGSVLATFLLQASLVVSGVAAARLLGPQQRGNLALLVLLPTILAKLGGLGIPLALPFFVARAPASAATIARLVFPIALLQAIVCVAIHATILLLILGHRMGDLQVPALLTLITVPTLLAFDYSLGLFQGLGRFGAFNLFRGLPASLYAFGVFGLLVLGAGNLLTVTLVLVLSGFLVVPICLLICLSGMPRRTRTGALPSRSQIARFGLKGLFGGVSPIESFRLDQAIVGLLLSPAALGLYVVALAFTNLPRFVSQSIGFVAYPHIAGKSDRGGEWAALRSFFLWSMALTIPVVVALVVAAGLLVPFFFGESFNPAIPVVRILLVGSLFLAARRILTDASRGAGYPGAGTIAEVASWIWLIPSVLLLSGPLGLRGIAVSFAGASGFSLLVLLAILQMHQSTADDKQEPRSPGELPAVVPLQ
jgi:O-antigen/teichoic acid export membrane protein